jgi:hypothetical protein
MEAQEQEVKLPHHFTKEYKKMKAEGLIDDKGVYVGPPLEDTEEVVQEAVEKEDSIPTSQVQAMFEKMFAERMKIAEAPKPIYQEQPRYRAEDNVDDVPELRNWEMKDRVYEMTDEVKAVTASISSQHTALIPLQYTNKETQSVHIMRYATNQPSFFVEKQSKELGSVLLAEIMFSFGRLSVPANNIVLQKFLAIHPHLNKTFREYDPLAISRKVVSEKKIKLKAGALVFEVGDIINRAIASLEFPNYVDSWASDILEEELSAFAEKQPQKYIDYTQDNTIKMKGVIKASLASGELVYANYRFLNKKRETILEVAKNQNEMDEMVLFFESGLGRTTYEYLLNRL